ncbi:hypothetical protein BJV77DRAFT_947082, partial [Russula vinacea]
PLIFPSLDFLVTYPTKGIEVSNGQTFPLTWTKGLLDGIDIFDLELTRMSTDGLILLARDIPTTSGGINIQLNSVPPGDDYFFLLLNSTHGLMYANSQKFSIGSSGNATVKPLPSKPTVTANGGPNPTLPFATTFALLNNGVRPWHPSPATLVSAGLMSFALLAGAAAVL